MRRFIVSCLVVIAIPSIAGAQTPLEPSEAPSREALGVKRLGFGKRSSTVFTVENVFGYVREKEIDGGGYSDGRDTLGHTGLFPGTFGPRVGFHGISSSGFTYGIGFGFTLLSVSSGGQETATGTVISAIPRFGYVLNLGSDFAVWLRGGPGVRMIAAGDPQFSIGVGAELQVVFSPVDHFGVTLGPATEAFVTPGRGESISVVGLQLGLLADY